MAEDNESKETFVFSKYCEQQKKILPFQTIYTFRNKQNTSDTRER